MQHAQIFVNLPVKDLKRSVEFFTKLGYTRNSSARSPTRPSPTPANPPKC
jgi:predicted lactoylglutathione lyase